MGAERNSIGFVNAELRGGKWIGGFFSQANHGGKNQRSDGNCGTAICATAAKQHKAFNCNITELSASDSELSTSDAELLMSDTALSGKVRLILIVQFKLKRAARFYYECN